MNAQEAIQRMREVLRLKHLALSTEESYCGWVLRYAEHLRSLPAGLPCERKIESFLTKLAKQNVSASTQNQAFNARARWKWSVPVWPFTSPIWWTALFRG
jgi:hypothetical protein